jgi:hypothetical protein
MTVRTLLLAGLLAACGQPAAAPRSADAGNRSEDPIAMPGPRAAHGAVTLPDGRVLLVGGCVLESCEVGPDSASVDSYDPRSGVIRRTGTLLDRRVSGAVILLGSGEVLIAGGWTGPAVSDLVELWDPRTGRSRRGPPLARARADLAATRLDDGRVLLAGGFDGRGPVDLVEIFDPATGKVTRAGTLVVPRAGAGVALLPGGKALIVGGGTGPDAGEPTAAAEIFEPKTGRSAPAGSLTQARYKHSTVSLADGRALVLGGSDSRDREGKLALVERFDPGTGTFAAAGRLLDPRYKIGGAVLVLPDGKVLVAGGAPRAELYDPASGRSVRVGPDMGATLNFATASLLADGSALIAGGYDENGIRMSRNAWLLRPADR